MGKTLHARATTTQRIREEMQQSSESISALAQKYGINIKTAQNQTEDMPMGKRNPCSTVLTATEEKGIVTCRVLTRLSSYEYTDMNRTR